MSKIKFVSFFDENLVESFIVQYSSIEKNINVDFDFYIGVNNNANKKLNAFLRQHKNIKCVILNDKYSYLKNSLPLHVTNFSYARFYIFEYFPELIGCVNIIYTDPDIIYLNFPYHLINGNKLNFAFANNEINQFYLSSKIWEKKLSNTVYHDKISSLFENEIYFNAGILIINNTQKIQNLFNKCKNVEFDVDDQTLLNFYNDNDLITWNDCSWNFQIKHMQKDLVNVIHFSGKEKPWLIDRDNLNEGNKHFFEIYDEYKMMAISKGYLKKDIRKIKLLIINHDKEEKFIDNIIQTSNKIFDRYLEYIDIFLLSSKHSEKSKNKLLKSKINFFEFDENLKKFGKMREFEKLGILKSDDYVQIVDADDILIIELLPQLILTIQNTYADILRNTTLKIDPTLFGEEIYYSKNWSGISSNTIFRWGILNDYFNRNEYDGILSEDNIRYIYALIQKDNPIIQDIDIPFYLGVRWWKGNISHSSVHNITSDYEESKKIFELLKMESKNISSFFQKNRKRTSYQLKQDDILISWNLNDEYSRIEMKKKLKRIIFEHLREGSKGNVSFENLIEESLDLIKCIDYFNAYNIDKKFIIELMDSYEQTVDKKTNYNVFNLNVPGGLLSFDSETLIYDFVEKREK